MFLVINFVASFIGSLIIEGIDSFISRSGSSIVRPLNARLVRAVIFAIGLTLGLQVAPQFPQAWQAMLAITLIVGIALIVSRVVITKMSKS